MEYLILGLLLLTPMTGYELQRFIKQNLALICSSSAGSVQTALAKLEREGRIAAEEAMEGRRRKKTFSITGQGRQAFEAWVAQPMQAGKVKNMELARMFFLGLARPARRRHPGLSAPDGRDANGAHRPAPAAAPGAGEAVASRAQLG